MSTPAERARSVLLALRVPVELQRLRPCILDLDGAPAQARDAWIAAARDGAYVVDDITGLHPDSTAEPEPTEANCFGLECMPSGAVAVTVAGEQVVLYLLADGFGTVARAIDPATAPVSRSARG